MFIGSEKAVAERGLKHFWVVLLVSKLAQKIWMSCVARVKLQIRIKINERKKGEKAKQSV